MRELKKSRQCMEPLRCEGADRWGACDSDRSCKNTEIKSLHRQNNS